VVDVAMCDQDMLDVQARRRCGRGQFVGPVTRIDHRGFAAAAITEEVAEVAIAAQVQLLDDGVAAREVVQDHSLILR